MILKLKGKMKRVGIIGGVKLKVQGCIECGDCFIVICKAEWGSAFYGYGNTIREAKEKCIKAGAKRRKFKRC